ncbi:MAG TPA: DNA replication/repair protein RecF [Gammaproteobacteria bacterium]|nr:DNA replication/repair protein RecF [Gammaproteobacteria bacterium]
MLAEINISDVRNIESTTFEFGPRFNVFYGDNGGGKTSVLESIYLLATAKSFRSSHARKIINENKQSLVVFGRIKGENESIKVGIEKALSSSAIRVNGSNLKSVSELAELLPVLVIEQDSHKLLEAGPQERRKFLDWGLFHVKHEFTSIWASYKKNLKQRNALLAQGTDSTSLDSWTVGLSEDGETYSTLRSEYINELAPFFKHYAEHLLGKGDYELIYKRGWPKEISLLECMSSHISRDIQSGRTNYGPHRADLLIYKNGKDVRDLVSRGQQKLLVYALNLAQVSLLKSKNGKETMLLLDDLGSELDLGHSSNLLTLLDESFGQVCITTANLDTIPLADMNNVKLFHVKHGSIEVINELSVNNDE